MIKAKDLLELADKQVGTMDKPIGSCNNKYNTAYYGGKVNNPALAWCVVFIWWLFRWGPPLSFATAERWHPFRLLITGSSSQASW